VNDDFKTLIDFLSRHGSEVSGRAMAQPDATVAAMIERFARGECEETERRDVCEMLRSQPAWLRWLADRVRMARARPESAAQT
jgi:hypothetical protein